MRRLKAFSDEYVKTLISLGLNGSQARVYLALLATGVASVREASKTSRVSRPDTYRAIMRLEEIGLLERVVVTPIKYKPLPLFEALSILIGRKEKENIELQHKAAKLYESLKDNSLISQYDATYQFVLIPQGEALLLKQQKLIQDAKEGISFALPKKNLLNWLLNNECVDRALSKQVTIKILTERNSMAKEPKVIQELINKQTLDLRYTDEPLTFCFAIYDRKEVLLTISSNTKSPAVWSNNPGFVELAQSYFDTEWFAASQMLEQFDFLFTKMVGGFSYNRIVVDSTGNPIGYIVIKANDAFLKMFDLSRDVIGKQTTKLLSDIKNENLKGSLLRIAQGEMDRFTCELMHREQLYWLFAYSPQKDHFILIAQES